MAMTNERGWLRVEDLTHLPIDYVELALDMYPEASSGEVAGYLLTACVDCETFALFALWALTCVVEEFRESVGLDEPEADS